MRRGRPPASSAASARTRSTPTAEDAATMPSVVASRKSISARPPLARSRRSSAPRSGVIGPPAPSARATSVAKYQPPERISSAEPSASTSPSPIRTTRSAKRGGELDVMGRDQHRRAGFGELAEATRRARAFGRCPCRGSARRGRSVPGMPLPRRGPPSRSPARGAGALRPRGRAGRRRPLRSSPTAASAASPSGPGSSSPTRSRTSRSPGACGTSAQPAGASALPRRGSTRPAIARRSVDFPAPFRPISATTSPGSMRSERSRITSCGPSPWSSSTQSRLTRSASPLRSASRRRGP